MGKYKKTCIFFLSPKRKACWANARDTRGEGILISSHLGLKKVITSQAPLPQCEVAVLKSQGSWGVVRREGMYLGL